jgi:hypothetical protein
VLADGTYATQAAVAEASSAAALLGSSTAPNLRALLLGGDFFLGGVIAGALTKLVLRWRGLSGPGPAANARAASAMLSIVSILRLGSSGSAALGAPLDEDSRDRMFACLAILADPHPDMAQVGGGGGEGQRGLGAGGQVAATGGQRPEGSGGAGGACPAGHGLGLLHKEGGAGAAAPLVATLCV